MTLTELRYITAVARERHFGRAAAACFVSQPTLSVAVKKLEEELGVTLFERTHTDIAPTPIGEKVVNQAQRVLEEAQNLKTIVSSAGDPLKGPLRIGVIYTIGPYLLPSLIPTLNDMAPQMPLLVEEGYTAQLRKKLKNGELDVIIIALPFEESGVITAPVFEEPFIVLIPGSHPWIEKPVITTDDLPEETVLLLGQGHCFRDQVLEVCPECAGATTDGSLQAALEGSSLETIRHMVASGVGVTVLPCTAAGADLYPSRMVQIKRFKGTPPSRTVALAWRKSFVRMPAINVLHKAINQCPLTCVEMIAPTGKEQPSPSS